MSEVQVKLPRKLLLPLLVLRAAGGRISKKKMQYLMFLLQEEQGIKPCRECGTSYDFKWYGLKEGNKK